MISAARSTVRRLRLICFTPAALIVAACMISVVAAVGLQAWSVRARMPIPSATQPGSRQKLQTELITINPGGFFPRSVKRPEGKFFLAIDNRSGVVDVTLRLSRKNGPKVREAPVTRNQPDWIELVDLAPGDYELTEAGHPTWVCQITIAPN